MGMYEGERTLLLMEAWFSQRPGMRGAGECYRVAFLRFEGGDGQETMNVHYNLCLWI